MMACFHCSCDGGAGAPRAAEEQPPGLGDGTGDGGTRRVHAGPVGGVIARLSA